MTRVLEGTWAEIAAHAGEWENKRLRVVVDVLDEQPADDADAPTLLERIKDLVGSVEGGPDDLAENHKKYFAEIMDEKYARDMAKSESKLK